MKFRDKENAKRLRAWQWAVLLSCVVGVSVMLGYATKVVEFGEGWPTSLWTGGKAGLAGFVVMASFSEWLGGTEKEVRRMKYVGRTLIAVIAAFAVVVTSVSAASAHPLTEKTEQVPDGHEEYQVQVGTK